MARAFWKSCLGAAITLATLAGGAALASRERFVIDAVKEPSSLDPHVQWNPESYYVYRSIFDSLVTRDDKGDLAPQLATAWRSLSHTEFTFDLRSDVIFHDGSRLTAEDVVYSVKRVTDPKFASPQLSVFNKIKDAVALSPTQVKLTMDGPHPLLLPALVGLSIVPKAVVESVGRDAFNLKPLGSGPYRFESWQRGVAVTLLRNDSYWGGKGRAMRLPTGTPRPTATASAPPASMSV